jgi:glycolate oxidase iron-sulfur subunit
MEENEFVKAELNRCNKCGYCMQSCPTYRANRRELSVARGRNQILREAVESDGQFDPETLDPFFECLLCGACTVDCFGKVQTAEMMVRAREALHSQHGRPAIQKYIFGELLPHPDRLARLVRLLALGKSTHLSDAAQKMGLLRWLSPTLAAADGLVTQMPRRFLRDRLAGLGFAKLTEGGAEVWRLEPERATGPKLLYFVGCGTNFQTPRAGEAMVRLLSKAGCQVTVAANNCCGLPPWSYGDFDSARALARKNLDLLSGLDFDQIVTDCGSCSGFLKKWGSLVADDPRAAELAGRTRDFTEVMAQLPLPRPSGPEVTVTYHDPCHLGRGQGVIEQPRKLLTDIGGFRLAELTEANWCCGAAGSYNITHPDMSRDVLGRKLSRIEETDAALVATACPACVIQLAAGGRRRHWKRPVKHIAELLAERQGLMEER